MRIRHILCAMDLSDAAAEVAWAAIQMAEHNKADLTFIHVVVPSRRESSSIFGTIVPRAGGTGGFRVEDLEAAEREDQVIRARLGQWLGHARERTSGKVELELSRGDPADEIIEYTRTGHYDLLVVGRGGEPGLLKSLLGTVSYKVVRSAQCSVLTIAGAPAGGRSS